MKNNKWLKVSVVILILTMTPLSALAQLPPFDPNVDDEAPSAPISGLVAVGLIAGAGYGLKKIRDTK